MFATVKCASEAFKEGVDAQSYVYLMMKIYTTVLWHECCAYTRREGDLNPNHRSLPVAWKGISNEPYITDAKERSEERI